MEASFRLQLLAAGRPVELTVTILFVGGLIALIVGIWFFLAQREKKRTAALQQIAEQLRFSFQPKGDADFFAYLESQGFSLFSRHSGRKLQNLQRGKSQNIEVALFDYLYVVHTGQHSNVTRQTVVSFQSAALALPQFLLAPKTIFHKIGTVFGSKNIEFEGHPKFDKTYVLRGTDAETIHQVFTDEVLSFFGENSGWQTEGYSQCLLLYKPGKRVPPLEISGLLETGLTVLSQFHNAG